MLSAGADWVMWIDRLCGCGYGDSRQRHGAGSSRLMPIMMPATDARLMSNGHLRPALLRYQVLLFSHTASGACTDLPFVRCIRTVRVTDEAALTRFIKHANVISKRLPLYPY